MKDEVMRSHIRSAVASTVLSLVAVVAADRSVASEQVLQCPEQVPPGSIRLADNADGWMAFVPEPLRLTAAGFMQGPPSTRADLKPSATKRTSAGSVVKWAFEGAYPEGKWLSCEYAQGVVALARRIDDSAAECSVEYQKTKHGELAVQRIVCR